MSIGNNYHVFGGSRENLTGPFSKEYLRLLVKEIVLDGDSVKIKGGYASLAGAMKFAAKKKELSTSGEVLNSNNVWRPRVDSNDRPLP